MARTLRGHSPPNARAMTVIAQDPSVMLGERILTSELTVPAERLLPGPRGYRVNVIDYDSTTDTLYMPADASSDGAYEDFVAAEELAKLTPRRFNERLLSDPRFHAQNVYAIVMRTMAQFEFALGRRARWGSKGHQIHVVPHAFQDANAFYSREDRAIFFGYFTGAKSGKPVYTCLSHDVVAHETTHAILDGLRPRYMEQSTADQAAFHEGFADIVALLSVFSLPEVVGKLLEVKAQAPRAGSRGREHRPRASSKAPRPWEERLIDRAHLTREALAQSVLFGLADQMGDETLVPRQHALRRSVELKPGKDYMQMPGYEEPHARGELLVAATMNAFLAMWLQRIAKIGRVVGNSVDLSLVVEEGARVAVHLLTMSIRALDYCPPTDIWFSDYLSALLTVDREVVPDQGEYDYRRALLDNFRAYGIQPAEGTDDDGTWRLFARESVSYGRNHFDLMLRDREEVFRFIWENRDVLKVRTDSYVEVESVLPSVRIGPDGFILHETVAVYVQILTLKAEELKSVLHIPPPAGVAPDRLIRVFGGGTLIFNEYGQLKYHIPDRLEEIDKRRQAKRIQRLADTGFFDNDPETEHADVEAPFANLHRARLLG